MVDISAAVESRNATAPSSAWRARWIAATLCIVYGFAKINGSQFTVLDSELSKPLGSVSGFWLTWYYFGYSWLYGTTIAIVQIAAGILLIIPRTSLLGATLLLPLVANIVAIDVLYGVDLGGTLAAVLLLGCVIAIMKPHFDRLRRALILSDAPLRVSTPAAIALPVLIVGAWSFTWWVANYNNRAPTSIDGTWSVIRQSAVEDSSTSWRTVFFERNRARMVVFRSTEGVDVVHDFEVGSDSVVRVWQTWLTKGVLIMQGRVRPDGDIDLDVLDPPGSRRLTLRRERSD